jgi:hypothetical protein
MSSLTCNPSFSVEFFVQPIYTDYAYFDKRSHLNLFLWNRWTKLNQASSHFEWRAGLSDTILKENHTRTIPAKFVLIWFSSFSGEDLNVIFYQNISNLYNQYIHSGFFCEIFSASLFRLGILWDKDHIKIFCSEICVEMIFGWPTFKIMCSTPIFYQL